MFLLFSFCAPCSAGRSAAGRATTTGAGVITAGIVTTTPRGKKRENTLDKNPAIRQGFFITLQEREKMIRFTKKGSEEEQSNFARVQYVIRAVSKDKCKPVFTRLYSDGGNIVGGDSHRLHIAPAPENIPDGFYDIIKNTAQEIILEPSAVDGQFPKYKQVIPSGRPDPVELAVYDAKTGGARCVFELFTAGVCLNINYIADACKDNYGMTVSVAGDAEPVVISSALGTAVIMPIQGVKND